MSEGLVATLVLIESFMKSAQVFGLLAATNRTVFHNIFHDYTVKFIFAKVKATAPQFIPSLSPFWSDLTLVPSELYILYIRKICENT
jgi:hypothetical protein